MDQKIYENHFVVHKEPSLPTKKISKCRPGRAFWTLILKVSHTLGRDHTEKIGINHIIEELAEPWFLVDGMYNSIHPF